MDQSLNLDICKCLIFAVHLPWKFWLSQSSPGDSEVAGYSYEWAAFVVPSAHAKPASHQLSTTGGFTFVIRAGSKDVKIPNYNP